MKMGATAKGFEEVNFRLGCKADDVNFAIAKSMADCILTLAIYIQEQKLSGQILKEKTGNLKESITPEEPVITSDGVAGRVYQDANIAIYGRILNDGGIIDHPGSDKFQAFMTATGMVFTHGTKPHQIPIPAFQYMQSALADMRQSIIDEISQAARSAASA